MPSWKAWVQRPSGLIKQEGVKCKLRKAYVVLALEMRKALLQ